MAETTGRNSVSSCIDRVEIVGQSNVILELDCFTDDSGTTFFGAWEIVDGTLQLVFYELDNNGDLIPYTPTSAPIPCDPNVTTQTEICWVALVDGVGYNAGDQIQQVNFFDTSTAPATLTATIWYNLTQRSVINTAPPAADLESCEIEVPHVTPGHWLQCEIRDNQVDLTTNADFGDTAAPGAVVPLVVDSEAIALQIAAIVRSGISLQDEEEAKGIPVTAVAIVTQGGPQFLVNPNSVGNVVGNTITFIEAEIQAWPGPLVDQIIRIEYTTHEDCYCRQIELVQVPTADGRLRLVGAYDATTVDVDGNKEQLTLPLPYGSPGPFPGPCISEGGGVSEAFVSGCYQDTDGNFFDAIVKLNEDGLVDQVVIDNAITDTSTGTLIVGRPCYACCVSSVAPETFQHVDLPHAAIATADGFLAGTTQYNSQLCGDTIRLDPFDLTVVATEAATSPEPIFTWTDAANGGAHRILIDGTGTVRMGFASCDGGMNETVEFITRKPDRISPGTGSSIPDQATLDGLALPIVWDNGNSSDPTYFEWDNAESVPFTVNSQDTITMRGFVDSVTFDNARKWQTDGCCDDDESDPGLSVGYLQTCDPFDITLPINVEGTFSDTAAVTSTLTSTTATITLITDAIRQAQDYENAEIQGGLPVTNFIIRTDNGSVFEFPPSALARSSGTTITLTTADLVAWPGALVDTIQRIEYSKFDNCGCQAVEMLQRITADGDVELLKVLDPSIRDENGLKLELTTPFTFGISGPFAGPCPESIPIFDLVPLCCDDDLLANNPDIANQRLAWLDGADTSLMLDAVGGVPIAGNQGDQVFEVQDKINPGVAPSFIIPTATAPGDTAPINPPTLDLDAINGLPVLNFDSTNRERMRLDTNNPAGNSFTLFYLVSATDLVLQSNATIIAVGPNNGDGDPFDNTDGSWQLSLDGIEPSFIFRSEMETTEYAAGVDPIDIVRTGPFSDERSPSNPFGDLYERAIAREADFFDGQLHLITVTWDNATNILSCFFDGDLRHQSDWTGFPLSTAAMASDYFRLFGNRQGAAFLSGQVAEMFFADAALTPEETSIVNAYLICKWGIDPTIAAGGAGDLTLAPAGTYGNPTPIVQITRATGDVIYRNTDTGLEFPVPPVPGLSICDAGGEGCCECPPLNTSEGIFNAPLVANFPANTIHSLSIQVLTGTADINGATIPVGPIVNLSGNDCQNNLGTAYTIDNFTGDTLIISTQY